MALTGEAGEVNVQKGVKRDTTDLLSCSHSAGESGGRKWCRRHFLPHGDAAGQDASMVPL